MTAPSVISVTLEDAQGAVLVNPDELSSRDRDLVAGILLELQQDRRYSGFFRPSGTAP